MLDHPKRGVQFLHELHADHPVKVATLLRNTTILSKTYLITHTISGIPQRRKGCCIRSDYQLCRNGEIRKIYGVLAVLAVAGSKILCTDDAAGQSGFSIMSFGLLTQGALSMFGQNLEKSNGASRAL